MDRKKKIKCIGNSFWNFVFSIYQKLLISRLICIYWFEPYKIILSVDQKMIKYHFYSIQSICWLFSLHNFQNLFKHQTLLMIISQPELNSMGFPVVQPPTHFPSNPHHLTFSCRCSFLCRSTPSLGSHCTTSAGEQHELAGAPWKCGSQEWIWGQPGQTGLGILSVMDMEQVFQWKHYNRDARRPCHNSNGGRIL